MNRDEMLNFLKNEARGISVMFGPNCETIVHDMTRPGHPILAIFNGTVTGREVGSTADIFGDIGDYDESIYQNKDYINQMVLSRDGRTLKSSTFNIVGEDYHFALGINLDITNMVRAGQMLSELTATSGDLQQTLMQDARSQLEELLRECISAVGKEPEAMKKTDRMRIIRMLYKRRAFTYQKSVAIVAERLNVSRYTVYKYMHELEEAEAEARKAALPPIELEPQLTEPVDFDTFCKNDFRAVKVKACEAVKKSAKLLRFTLDDGTGTDRQILSGIHAYYEPEELVGKTLVAIVNLPPRKMMGLESQGMLLSAVHTEKGEEKLNLIMVDDAIPAGAKLC